MSEVAGSDNRPRVEINGAAWRAIAIALLVAALALVGALVAQVSLTADDASPSDPLTTVALVLAVLAFLVQLFVYAFQTRAATHSAERAEELTTKTQALLDEIRATSETTKQVLFSQFDRLLDYVVKGGIPTPEDADTEELDDGNDPTVVDGDHTLPELVEQTVRRVMLDSQARAPRMFSGQAAATSSEADEHELTFLRSWPSQEEARAAVAKMAVLSPMALMRLKRFVDREIDQRKRGRRVGLIPAQDFPGASQELIEAGFVRRDADRNVLTSAGRDAGRLIMSGRKDSAPPPWMREVMAPLTRAQPASAER